MCTLDIYPSANMEGVYFYTAANHQGMFLASLFGELLCQGYLLLKLMSPFIMKKSQEMQHEISTLTSVLTTCRTSSSLLVFES